jgi:hypothetical protein
MTSCFDETDAAKDSALRLYRRPSAQNRFDLLVLGHRGRNKDKTQHPGGKLTLVPDEKPSIVFRNALDAIPGDAPFHGEPIEPSAALNEISADNQTAAPCAPFWKSPAKYDPKHHRHHQSYNEGFTFPMHQAIDDPAKTKHEKGNGKKQPRPLPPRHWDYARQNLILAHGSFHGFRSLNILNRAPVA